MDYIYPLDMSTENNKQKRLVFTDISNKKIRVGQKVILNIENGEEYLGEICLISKDRNRIQLTNVSLRKNNEEIFGDRQFYRPEINSIEILLTENDHEETDEELTEVVSQQYVKFKLGDNEFQVIESMIRQCVYIKHKNQEFEDALKDISKQDFVGLFAEGVENGKNGKLTLLAISTPHKIYVMDFTAMAFDVSLCELFMSNRPVKVMHDASFLSDYLYHCHGVKLKEVFDTMIAHMALGYSETRTTLRECIAEHMILPFEFMDAFDCNKESTDVENHGKSTEVVNDCSRNVAILLKFHGFLTEKLLHNAYASFEKNLNFSRNSDIKEVGFRYTPMNANEKKLDRIPPFTLNVIDSKPD